MPKGDNPHNRIKTCDHEGNEFASVSAMCRRYNLPISTYKNRLQRGWTLKQALTTPNDSLMHKHNHKKIWTDHNGDSYTSLREMCEHYGITTKIFWGRKRQCGWELEKILTTPRIETPSNAKAITDHLGNSFASVSEMCRYHSVSLTMYKERIKLGWDIEKALTTPAKKMNNMKPQECYDHLGNRYPSKNAMCRAYNIGRYMLNSRLELGWGLEKALTAPIVIHASAVTDHLNRRFATLKDMANFYGIPDYRLQSLYENNIDENRIAKLVKYYYKDRDIDGWKIIKCIEFPYFLTEIDGKNIILHFERILDRYHNSNLFEPLTSKKAKAAINVKRLIEFPYYLIEIDSQETVESYFRIIEMNAENNFGLSRKGDKA